MNYPKVVRNGKVAVLVALRFGAGWSTWNGKHPELLFDPEVVELVEAGKSSEIQARMDERYGAGEVYCGASELCIEWLPEGTEFYVHEYDGSESVKTKDSDNWSVA